MSADSGAAPAYSFIIPVYNEEESLPELHRRMRALMDGLDGPAEVIFIDDGSADNSYALLTEMSASDPRARVIRFSRNFGTQIAITAGLDHAAGRAVVIMDADLQHPPEVVPEMIARWKEGYDIVYAVRDVRDREGWFKRAAASAFYRLLRRLAKTPIPADVGDFRLVDRKAVDAVRHMRERSRFLRGMFAWVGFRQIGVPYCRPERFAGKTKYSFRTLAHLALDGVLGFSNVPLRLALVAGTIVAGGAFVYGLIALILKLCGWGAVSGWTSLIVTVSFLGGVQLMVMGILGEYLARMYDDVRGRPLYIVSETQGFPGMPGAAPTPRQ